MATPLASSALFLHGDLLVFHSCVLVFIGGQFRDLPGRSMEETYGGPFGALAKEPNKGGTMPEPPKHSPGSWPTPSETWPPSGRKPPKARPVPCPCAVHPVSIPFPSCSLSCPSWPSAAGKTWGFVPILRPVPCPSAVHPVSIRCPSPVHPALFLSILPFGGWKSVGNPVHPAPPSGLCIILKRRGLLRASLAAAAPSTREADVWAL